MDNLATQSPTIFTTTGAGSLFNIATPSSPYNWIKSEEKMGIIRGVIHDISQNLQNQAKYLEYGKAQFQGSSNATTIDNNGQPLGNRYFVSASGKKCMTIPDSKIVDQCYVIDGMAGPKNTTNGVAFSAAATLSNIDSQNITPFFVGNSDDSINFKSPENDIDYKIHVKKIVITTDGNGNTDSNYVSKIDADKLIADGIAKEAFQNHPYNRNNNRLVQEHHHFVYGHNPSNWHSMTDFGGYIIGADIADDFYFHNQNIVMNNHHIPVLHTSYATIDYLTDDDYNRARQWLKDHNKQPQKERNVITGFFLGSMTVIGLLIVFRLLDRSSASRFR